MKSLTQAIIDLFERGAVTPPNYPTLAQARAEQECLVITQSSPIQLEGHEIAPSVDHPGERLSSAGDTTQ